MPNHCYNRVQISNDAEDNSKQFDELVAIFESQKPFSKIIPIPNFLEIPNEDGELPVVVEHKNDKGEVIFTTSEFPKSKPLFIAEQGPLDKFLTNIISKLNLLKSSTKLNASSFSLS